MAVTATIINFAYLEDASTTGDISTDTVLLAFVAAIPITITNLRVTHTRVW